MTASRDQDLRQYALDLGYEDRGRVAGAGCKYVHSRTRDVVRLPDEVGDYQELRGLLAELRRGAAVSNRGRGAVVNDRRVRKTKKGANSARLEQERLERQRREYQARADERPAQPEPVPAAVLRRLAELRSFEGLMRGV